MKKMRSQRATGTLIASAVSATLVLSLGSGIATAKSTKADAGDKHHTAMLTDNETLADHAGWNDAGLADVASHGGRVLLRQVRDVQTALQVGDIEGARYALKSAHDYADTLKPLMPYTVITDNVSDSHDKLVATDAGVAVDQMLPIYGDLTTVTAYVPAKGHTAKTTASKAKSKPATAGAETVPVGEDIASDVVYLPVLFVAGQTQLASAALAQDPPDTAAAKQAIDDALSSLVVSQSDVHLLPSEPAANAS